jgi:hypothetical protein
MLPRTIRRERCLTPVMRRCLLVVPALATVFVLVTCGADGAASRTRGHGRSHVAYVLDLGFFQLTVRT